MLISFIHQCKTTKKRFAEIMGEKQKYETLVLMTGEEHGTISIQIIHIYTQALDSMRKRYIVAFQKDQICFPMSCLSFVKLLLQSRGDSGFFSRGCCWSCAPFLGGRTSRLIAGLLLLFLLSRRSTWTAADRCDWRSRWGTTETDSYIKSVCTEFDSIGGKFNRNIQR